MLGWRSLVGAVMVSCSAVGVVCHASFVAHREGVWAYGIRIYLSRCLESLPVER
jgi:hypothetical protein